ncbi:hypothetical protein [Actinomadura fibrosa]|uniref:Uncharacterized protein n=1 Tax=Actinomadura fibrosa TaxID=111802 RepID=A0ABW2XT76_9ACTN|nr:hypothetical protein [Actinomadura fibrosa]
MSHHQDELPLLMELYAVLLKLGLGVHLHRSLPGLLVANDRP